MPLAANQQLSDPTKLRTLESKVSELSQKLEESRSQLNEAVVARAKLETKMAQLESEFNMVSSHMLMHTQLEGGSAVQDHPHRVRYC